MPEPTDANAGFDALLDAIESGDGYYLECEHGHGSLPPRRACPQCGSTDLSDTELPEAGQIETYTVVHVATPQLADDVPYVTAIARFDSVQLSGFLRGVDDPTDAVGRSVHPAIEQTETTGQRVIVLRPV